MTKRHKKKPSHYVHPGSQKAIINKAINKFGSLRQLGLKLDCSIGHVYRWKNNECRMGEKWYQTIESLLAQ